MDTWFPSTFRLLWIMLMNMDVQLSGQVSVFNFWGYVLRREIAGLYSNFVFNFFQELPDYFPQCPYHFTFSPVMHKCSISLHPHQCGFFYYGQPNECEAIPHCNLICISLIIYDVKHLSMCLLDICISFWRNFYSSALSIFELGC